MISIKFNNNIKAVLKTSIILLVGLVSYLQAETQRSNILIAPFKIRLTNGEGYTYQQLEKNKPVILIYFSPTCDHCKTFIEAMLKRMNKLQDNQFVMISYEHINDVKTFDDAYKLSGNPNIKIGSEGYTFVVQKYYNIQQFPFVVEYDKSGKLKKILSNNLQPVQMANQL